MKIQEDDQSSCQHSSPFDNKAIKRVIRQENYCFICNIVIQYGKHFDVFTLVFSFDFSTRTERVDINGNNIYISSLIKNVPELVKADVLVPVNVRLLHQG